MHNLAFLLTDDKSVDFSCHSKFVGRELEVFYSVCNESTTTCAKEFTYNLLLQCYGGLQSAQVKELARCSKFNKYSWHHVSSGIINHYYKEQSKEQSVPKYTFAWLLLLLQMDPTECQPQPLSSTPLCRWLIISQTSLDIQELGNIANNFHRAASLRASKALLRSMETCSMGVCFALCVFYWKQLLSHPSPLSDNGHHPTVWNPWIIFTQHLSFSWNWNCYRSIFICIPVCWKIKEYLTFTA